MSERDVIESCRLARESAYLDGEDEPDYEPDDEDDREYGRWLDAQFDS